jgi:hypothetical protein
MSSRDRGVFRFSLWKLREQQLCLPIFFNPVNAFLMAGLFILILVKETNMVGNLIEVFLAVLALAGIFALIVVF